jgi:hypothetical protein
MAEIIGQRRHRTRAASLGTVGEIISLRWATSSRNAWATSSESASFRASISFKSSAQKNASDHNGPLAFADVLIFARLHRASESGKSVFSPYREAS